MKTCWFRPGHGLLIAISLICLLAGRLAQAGSATWKADPISNDWNTAANWTPESVPNGPSDLARFAGSGVTNVKFSSVMIEVAEIVFTPAAGSFNLTADSDLAHTSVTLTISGHGITNNSAVTQNLTANPNGANFGLGTIEFRNAATAGGGTLLTALGSSREGGFSGSEINFYDTSTAATASFVAEGATGSLDA